MAKKKNKEENKGGRPTKYEEKYNEQARKLCLLGYTDKELADFFEICEATLNNWKIEYPEFLESIKKGKDIADAEVVESLFQRATGYEHEETKFFQYEGSIISEDTVKHYPPDVGAAALWLKNRQTIKWAKVERMRAEREEEENKSPTKVEIEIITKPESDDIEG